MSAATVIQTAKQNVPTNLEKWELSTEGLDPLQPRPLISGCLHISASRPTCMTEGRPWNQVGKCPTAKGNLRINSVNHSFSMTIPDNAPILKLTGCSADLCVAMTVVFLYVLYTYWAYIGHRIGLELKVVIAFKSIFFRNYRITLHLMNC